MSEGIVYDKGVGIHFIIGTINHLVDHPKNHYFKQAKWIPDSC